jgi:hypothetical protein
MNSLTVGELVRVDRTFPGGKRQPVHKVTCFCGNVFEVRLYKVRSGSTRSCGCLAGQAFVRHGASRGGALTPEYRAWRCMLTRAKNPKIARAKHYSGRGIGVATEWDSGGDGRGYERFLAHIGPKPSPGMSVDRRDNDRGYEPGNVRWATTAEQVRNKSDNRILTFGGKSACVAEWAEVTGIPCGTIRDRIGKLGWPVERALTHPLRADRRRLPS